MGNTVYVSGQIGIVPKVSLYPHAVQGIPYNTHSGRQYRLHTGTECAGETPGPPLILDQS